MTDIKKDILWRVYLVYISMFIFGIVIIGKIIYIQTSQGAKFKAMAKNQEIKSVDLEANRGNIFDNEGKLLSTSVPIFELRFAFLV